VLDDTTDIAVEDADSADVTEPYVIFSNNLFCYWSFNENLVFL